MNGCEAREEIQVFDDTCSPVNILENTLTNIEVYPNPTRDIFNISFDVNSNNNIQVRIINSLGHIVFADDLSNYIGQYKSKIDLNAHSKGIYLLQIVKGQDIINKKLILQ